MIEQVMNHDLLWERISNYVGYSELNHESKKNIDKIYLSIYDTLYHAYENNKHIADVTNIYDLDITTTEDLRGNLGNWLIDNSLNLVFSNLFSSHVIIRKDLMTLHCFKNGMIKTFNALSIANNIQISDIYTGLHYGAYLSGGSQERDIKKQKIIVGSKYFFTHKKLDRLTRAFDIEVIPFEKSEAEIELNDILNVI